MSYFKPLKKIKFYSQKRIPSEALAKLAPLWKLHAKRIRCKIQISQGFVTMARSHEPFLWHWSYLRQKSEAVGRNVEEIWARMFCEEGSLTSQCDTWKTAEELQALANITTPCQKRKRKTLFLSSPLLQTSHLCTWEAQPPKITKTSKHK